MSLIPVVVSDRTPVELCKSTIPRNLDSKSRAWAGCFEWRKKPASDRHFTVVAVFGKRVEKRSQWIITDNPPAEPPVRNACVASFIPLFTSRSSTTASKILLPLKWRPVVGSTLSMSPVNDDPSHMPWKLNFESFQYLGREEPRCEVLRFLHSKMLLHHSPPIRTPVELCKSTIPRNLDSKSRAWAGCFEWRKKPASDRHFTVVAVFGKRVEKRSQWIITDNPPAEPPVRNACVASFIPLFTSRSSTTASKILLPLKWRPVVGSTLSMSPVNDDPSQYLTATLFQL
nr:hypothetical protein Iba_chr14eCG7450 [Ipomoea batatas]